MSNHNEWGKCDTIWQSQRDGVPSYSLPTLHSQLGREISIKLTIAASRYSCMHTHMMFSCTNTMDGLSREERCMLCYVLGISQILTASSQLVFLSLSFSPLPCKIAREKTSWCLVSAGFFLTSMHAWTCVRLSGRERAFSLARPATLQLEHGSEGFGGGEKNRLSLALCAPLQSVVFLGELFSLSLFFLPNPRVWH